MIQQDIFINWAPQETRVAIVEDGLLQELHQERSVQKGLVGNVYLGKVVRVLPGMQSAFIDIGLERAGFLHVADLVSTIQQRFTRENREHFAASVDENTDSSQRLSRENTTESESQASHPIEKQVFEGQILMVQVLKDPIGTKGARLTTQISLSGRQMVYLPQDNHIGISQKIPQDLRETLKTRVQQLSKQARDILQIQHQRENTSVHKAAAFITPEKEGGGYIVRTNAGDASDEELLNDIVYLKTTWRDIQQKGANFSAKSMIYQNLNLLQRVMRDMVNEQTRQVFIDSKMQFEELRTFASLYTPSACNKIVHYQGENPIFDLYNIEQDIQQALDKRVNLKSGGYLIIDQTEAMTTVDVNTGAFVGSRSFDETIFKTNLEATSAIIRQLRLRNLGGIIILDFIDMQIENHKKKVLETLITHLQRDRAKTMVSDFSSLGLIEMTRKRIYESLRQATSETCPECMGSGYVKTARTVAYEILREILREARQFNPSKFSIVAHPQVIEALEGEENQYLLQLSEFIGKPIALLAQADLSVYGYDIVLN